MNNNNKSISLDIYGELRKIITNVQEDLMGSINSEFETFYQTSFKNSLKNDLTVFDIRELGSELQEKSLNKILDTIEVFKALLKESLRRISFLADSEEVANALLENLEVFQNNSEQESHEKQALEKENSLLKSEIANLEKQIENLKPYFHYTVKNLGRILEYIEIEEIKKEIHY